MSKSSSITIIVLLFCAGSLLGCTKSSDDTPSHSPIPGTSTPFSTSTQTLTPTSTPTPQPKFTFSGITLLSNETDGLSVLGLIQNEINNPVSQIDIQVSVYADKTLLIDQVEILLPIHSLQPGEGSPFSLQFKDIQTADHVEIEVVDFQMSIETDIEIDVEIINSRITEGKKFTILGWISNNQNTSAQIHNFTLLTRDSGGTAQSLSMPELHVSSLLPSQRAPFITILEQDPSTISVTPFLDATELKDLDVAHFSFPQKPELTQDTRGNLLLRGTIRNDDARSRWASCIVGLSYQNQLISLTKLTPPTPLKIGESRAFSLTQFLGWKPQFSGMDVELDLIDTEFYCDSLGSSEYVGQIFTLASEITGFETIGGSLIIRGEVSNNTTHSLSNPTVQADLRTIDGSVRASNWILLEETIEPGETSFFVLSVPLPKGTILPELEFDIRTIALLSESDLQF